MEENKSTSLKGRPEESYQLSKDLLKTFMSSDLYKSGQNNKLLAFDAMMGIADFTANILGALSRSSMLGDMVDELYSEILSQTLKDTKKFMDSMIAERLTEGDTPS